MMTRPLVITQLKDEFDRQLGSEKVLDMLFKGGKLQRVSNQFGNGEIEPAPLLVKP